MAMTLKDTLAQLESLGNEKVRARNKKNGGGENQFGVQLGDIRKLAAKIKTNDQLAIALWDTGSASGAMPSTGGKEMKNFGGRRFCVAPFD